MELPVLALSSGLWVGKPKGSVMKQWVGLERNGMNGSTLAWVA